LSRLKASDEPQSGICCRDRSRQSQFGFAVVIGKRATAYRVGMPSFVPLQGAGDRISATAAGKLSPGPFSGCQRKTLPFVSKQ